MAEQEQEQVQVQEQHPCNSSGDAADHLVAPVLKNVVATVNLCCKLDLKKIAAGALNVEYNPRRYGAAIMRIREPKATALLYHTGKIVVTGARDEHSSMLAARKFTRIIQKLGFPDVGFKDFKIRNMVAAADLGFLVSLLRLDAAHRPSCTYEPELFPGLFFRMARPKVSFLVFTSGKVVVVGAKTREEITQAFDNIYPVLLGFKKPEQPVDTREQQHIHRPTPEEEEDDEFYRSLLRFSSSSPTLLDFT